MYVMVNKENKAFEGIRQKYQTSNRRLFMI